jgi:plastocyanin
MTQRLAPTTVLTAAAIMLAACGSTDGGARPSGDGDGASSISLRGTDDLTFEPDELVASAGSVTVELASGQAVGHTFVIEGVSDDEAVVDAPRGETATGSADLEAGAYVFYCGVPGHRASGMEGSLIVEG